MPEYRRIFIEGGVYFFTLVTYQRKRIFSSALARLLLLQAIEHVQSYHPFTVVAHCILPDHSHFIWQLPEGDSDYSKRISAVKRRFSMKYCQRFNIPSPKEPMKIKRREACIWQRRYWEHFIRDEKDFQRHFDYLHFNPVKHSLVNQVCDWKASSFFKYVELGHYDLDWGGYNHIDEGDQLYGE
jgi:putative transposase